MKIVCISDTHDLHRELTVPAGDLLLHAGDFTFFGNRLSAVRDFNDWLGELPHAHKVITLGNHEHMLERNNGLQEMITNATVLDGESTTVGGLKIWGSSLLPHFDDALQHENSEHRAKVFATIPADTDILLTHCPPYGVLDASPADNPGPAGDPELRKAVVRVHPRLHVFGHIHASYGVRRTRSTYFVNAALFGDGGDLSNRPIVLEMRPRNGDTV